jgi:hypothetical protein
VWRIQPDGLGDATTIQAGVDAAVAGDSVVLTAGTYTGVGNRDVSFMGKAITVTSYSGAASTIIDCGGVLAAHSPFRMPSITPRCFRT